MKRWGDLNVGARARFGTALLERVDDVLEDGMVHVRYVDRLPEVEFHDGNKLPAVEAGTPGLVNADDEIGEVAP